MDDLIEWFQILDRNGRQENNLIISFNISERKYNKKKKTKYYKSPDRPLTYFPQPFAPTMIVTGKKNSRTCSSAVGLNDRTPRTESLLIDAILVVGRDLMICLSFIFLKVFFGTTIFFYLWTSSSLLFWQRQFNFTLSRKKQLLLIMMTMGAKRNEHKSPHYYTHAISSEQNAFLNAFFLATCFASNVDTIAVGTRNLHTN